MPLSLAFFVTDAVDVVDPSGLGVGVVVVVVVTVVVVLVAFVVVVLVAKGC